MIPAHVLIIFLGSLGQYPSPSRYSGGIHDTTGFHCRRSFTIHPSLLSNTCIYRLYDVDAHSSLCQSIAKFQPTGKRQKTASKKLTLGIVNNPIQIWHFWSFTTGNGPHSHIVFSVTHFTVSVELNLSISPCFFLSRCRAKWPREKARILLAVII